MATLTAYPSSVRSDATSLLILIAPAGVVVTWSLVGTGSLLAITGHTDTEGRAYAKYTPGTIGTSPVVTATYGA